MSPVATFPPLLLPKGGARIAQQQSKGEGTYGDEAEAPLPSQPSSFSAKTTPNFGASPVDGDSTAVGLQNDVNDGTIPSVLRPTAVSAAAATRMPVVVAEETGARAEPQCASGNSAVSEEGEAGSGSDESEVSL